jgi:isopentenyl-diphosphate delta-isomerase
MNEHDIVLVNEKDEEVGVMEKMQVHREGLLHRAFSVFVFDHKGKMLLQKRSAIKYHGGNLWSNACCSHPYPGESVEDAARRRLQEELGFVAPLQKIFEFVYKADVENGLVEHEYDHVFAGEYEGPILMNEREVADYCYESMNDIKWMIREQPHKFTSWFKLAFPSIETWWAGRGWSMM